MTWTKLWYDKVRQKLYLTKNQLISCDAPIQQLVHVLHHLPALPIDRTLADNFIKIKNRFRPLATIYPILFFNILFPLVHGFWDFHKNYWYFNKCSVSIKMEMDAVSLLLFFKASMLKSSAQYFFLILFLVLILVIWKRSQQPTWWLLGWTKN